MKSAAEREQTEGERERAREERGGERSEREHAAVTTSGRRTSGRTRNAGLGTRAKRAHECGVSTPMRKRSPFDASMCLATRARSSAHSESE